jgi:Peptidase A4 family
VVRVTGYRAGRNGSTVSQGVAMKMRVLVVVCACAAGLVPVASGSAAPVEHPPRIGGVASSTSANWAGYVAAGGTYNSVSATWTEPTVTCAAGETSFSSFWVGLDGSTSRTVEQIGTGADCRNGTATYYAWYELYPKQSGQLSLSVAPGDTVAASVTAGPSGSFTLTLSVNGGTPQTITATNRHAALASAEVITEAPSSNHGPHGTLPLADFDTVGFSNAMVNGAPLAQASPQEITMQQGSTVKAQPSPLGSDSFSVDWKHA